MVKEELTKETQVLAVELIMRANNLKHSDLLDL